jgi:nucleotidyltransferase/DNA polymerase involved in DNA repair
VTLLPVDDEIRRRLQLFGLRRLGQFARLPPAAVLAQFGWQGQHAHRLARGQDDRPVVPGQGERSESTMQEFDPPLDNLETLVAAAGHLAKELARRLVPLFLRASQLDVQVACVDSSILRARRLLAEPTADPGRLARLAEVLLRSLRYPDRAADLAIALSGLSAPSLHQLSLWQSPRQIDADNHLARLAARYGPDCIRHAVLVDPDHRLAQRRFGMQKAEG